MRGRPTLVNNVETLAHLALIARFGAGWFAALGPPANPGTALLTLSGRVARAGLYEVPLGVSVPEAFEAAGTPDPIQAVLVGGYFGVWVASAAVPHLTLDGASLGSAGASLGCGALFALGADQCGLAETAAVTRWLAGQSAGQCGPCVNGLTAIAGAVDGLVAGDRDGRSEQLLRRWADMVEGRGACRHPDGTVRFVRSALDVFRPDIEAHRRRGPCPGATVLPTPDLGAGWR